MYHGIQLVLRIVGLQRWIRIITLTTVSNDDLLLRRHAPRLFDLVEALPAADLLLRILAELLRRHESLVQDLQRP